MCVNACCHPLDPPLGNRLVTTSPYNQACHQVLQHAWALLDVPVNRHHNHQWLLIIEKAIAICPENDDSYVIGGGEIYNLALPFTDIIELTKVHHSFDADAFFPKINKSEWTLVESEENFKDEKHLYDYTYETYIRK